MSFPNIMIERQSMTRDAIIECAEPDILKAEGQLGWTWRQKRVKTAKDPERHPRTQVTPVARESQTELKSLLVASCCQLVTGLLPHWRTGLSHAQTWTFFWPSSIQQHSRFSFLKMSERARLNAMVTFRIFQIQRDRKWKDVIYKLTEFSTPRESLINSHTYCGVKPVSLAVDHLQEFHGFVHNSEWHPVVRTTE